MDILIIMLELHQDQVDQFIDKDSTFFKRFKPYQKMIGDIPVKDQDVDAFLHTAAAYIDEKIAILGDFGVLENKSDLANSRLQSLIWLLNLTIERLGIIEKKYPVDSAVYLICLELAVRRISNEAGIEFRYEPFFIAD